MKKLMIVAVLMLISLPTVSQADTLTGSSLQLGVGYRYKEDLPGALKSTESGWLPDVNLSYTYKKKSNFFARIYGDYASADITYDGTTQGGTPISYSDSHQKFFKFEADFGYAFGVTDKFLLIPYIGYGYRYWERGQARTTSTYITYEEDYSWSYAPIGLKADYDINERWNIGGTIAVNIMFNGKMNAYPSRVIAGLNDPEFTLGNKIGFYADLPITYKLSTNWSIVGTPWYEYSQIGRSDNVNITYGKTVIGYAYEPDSTTNQYGFNLGVSYSF